MRMENFLVNNRPLSSRDYAFDIAVAAAAFAFGALQLMLAVWNVFVPDEALRRLLGIENILPTASAFVALGLTTAPLVLRRRYSWPVFIFVLIVFVGLQGEFRSYSLAIVGPAVALYSIAAERSRNEAIVAMALAAVLLCCGVPSGQAANLTLLTLVQNLAIMAAAALAGYAGQTHRRYIEETEKRAFEAERTREEEAARRVEEERVRIAREVHDITAHSLSAVSVQAAAAERLIDRDPAAAKAAIATARATARDALDEIRGMIGVLRHGDDATETEPTTGTERLADLVSFLENAGIKTTLDVVGYQRDIVPAYVDVALYGIAREAATNIVRHARAQRAWIKLASNGHGVSLRVEDDGRGVAPSACEDEGCLGRESRTDGNGIPGMIERMGLLGGTLTTGARLGGGFYVEARVSLGERKGR